jgi:2-octaprenyl-6-methoxyphenol hydroxylase
VSGPADIAVVGGGPTGLAAALEFDRRGRAVTIVAPPRTGRDERTAALLAGSVAFLERIGLSRLIEDRAAPIRTLRIVDGTSRLIRAPEVAFHAGEIGLPAFGVNIGNADLVGALERRCDERGLPRIPVTVSGLSMERELVRLELASGKTFPARLVVAADGRGSRVRDAAQIAVRAWGYDQSALVVNLRHSRPHNDTSTEFHTEAGPFTLVPLRGRRSSLVWVDRTVEVERRMALADDALAAEIEARSASLIGTVAIEGPRQAFRLAGMTASRLVAGRIALVGEAAHLFPPIGAQGLNLGYRDVAGLAAAVDRDDPGGAAGLAAYERARHGDVLARTAAVDALNRTLLTGFLPVQALRGLGLFLLDRLPALRQAAMRQGLGVAAGSGAGLS